MEKSFSLPDGVLESAEDPVLVRLSPFRCFDNIDRLSSLVDIGSFQLFGAEVTDSLPPLE